MDHDKATPQELRWRIAQLERRLAEQERISNDISGSTIWRATAPLRKLLGPLSLLLRKSQGRAPKTHKAFAVSPVKRGNLSWPLTLQPWDPALSVHHCVIEFVWDTPPADSLVQQQPHAVGLRSLTISEDGVEASAPLVQIDFGTAGNGGSFKVYGFEAPETAGVWTRGRKSQILLWLPHATGKMLRLEISGGFRDKDLNIPAPRVVLNGQTLGTLTFRPDSLAQFTFLSGTDGALGILPAAPHNVSKQPKIRPLISVVILNYNKPYLTFLTICALLRAKTNLSYEVLILDNGSTSQNAAILTSMHLPIRWLRLDENRFFGEGNNIAVEMARGEAILLLNNDVFVEDFVIDQLYAALNSTPTIGACGPVFYYPDGTLQEAGSFIAKDGSVYQRGKGTTDFDLTQLPLLGEVDYISAACLMVRKAHFVQLGGFDLRYDPAYYEDSDFCLRLLDQGLATVLVRETHVVHIENATTAAPENTGLADNLTERHRAIFLTRWQSWLKSRNNTDLPNIAGFTFGHVQDEDCALNQNTKVNAAYTPYNLSQGGGERYLLSAALTMGSAGNHLPCAIVTPTRYSLYRVNTLCRELGLPSDILFPLALQQAASQDVERYFHMGNEVFPSAPGLGKSNVFHCQFPFPDSLAVPTVTIGLENLATYRVVVVNSEFTKDAYLRALARVSNEVKDVRVISPPVRLPSPLSRESSITKEKMILSIGRFCPRGHSKRQDLIVSAFVKLKASGRLVDWRLVLCGNVSNDKESIGYFERLQNAARGNDVDFILAPDRDQIDKLYLKAGVYVSATGVGITNPRDFHKCEHFGITVVEALFAGCIVLVAANGGPAEILKATSKGLMFANAHELKQQLLAATHIAKPHGEEVDHISLQQLYSDESFRSNWAQLWEEIA